MNQDQITELKQALALSTSNQTTDSILVAALTIAVSLAQNGYQSDQAAIAAAVAEQVGSVQTENAKLTADLATANDQITTLTAQVATDATNLSAAQALLPAFQAQIQTILADGSGSDNQIQEITALR